MKKLYEEVTGKEYNVDDFLDLIRPYTKLSPLELIKVRKARRIAEVNQIIINEKEHCKLGADFTQAKELEALFRFKSWTKKEFYNWSMSSRNQEPDSFALEQLISINEYKKCLIRK